MGPLTKAARRLGPKGLVVVAISSESPKVLDAWVRRRGLPPYAFGRDAGGRTFQAYGVTALPTYFLVDRDGRVKGGGGAGLKGVLRQAKKLLR